MSAEQLPEPNRTDWSQAACLDEDPELFFPIGESSRMNKWQIEEAKVVCLRCDIREKCLAYALGEGIREGIWGGLTGKERTKLKKRRPQASY